jgi:hypothetical protein
MLASIPTKCKSEAAPSPFGSFGREVELAVCKMVAQGTDRHGKEEKEHDEGERKIESG